MNITKTDIKDVLIIEPRIFGDNRGMVYRNLFKKNV